jgi:hypothetical protein
MQTMRPVGIETKLSRVPVVVDGDDISNVTRNGLGTGYRLDFGNANFTIIPARQNAALEQFGIIPPPQYVIARC